MKRTVWTLPGITMWLALAAAGCTDQQTSTSSRVDTENNGPGGGTCAEILESGCDGATGEKLAACEATIQEAYDECVRIAPCHAAYEAAIAECGKDEACHQQAYDAFVACVGPRFSEEPTK